MGQAIIYSDGYSHPFAETSPLLADLARGRGWSVAIEASLDAVLERLNVRDLLIVNALRWSMTQHEKYAADRPQWAVALPDAQMRRLDDHVRLGGTLLVMHTGTICWDNQPGWAAIMGGGWRWGVSHHPPLGTVRVALTGAGRAMSNGPAQFDIVDEAYHHLSPAADCEILATADAGEGPQPVAWIRRHGTGRVGVDALGHDGRSLRDPGHGALIGSMLGWLGEET
nr:ThuA domain-containing protein [Sphingomonas sp. Y57]